MSTFSTISTVLSSLNSQKLTLQQQAGAWTLGETVTNTEGVFTEYHDRDSTVTLQIEELIVVDYV